jgi:prepilin-type N-terminal cleavage/methylation domain-containing protein
MRGFSLVELSIVLVILGLLTGGILAGQSLIHASELRSITADSQRYQASVTTFRDKFFGVPGDMRNAVKFWGAQAGALTDGVDATCAALTYTTPATGLPTCNGNGDGTIGGTLPAEYYERYRAWQHLANAGLVEGSYAGVEANGGGAQLGFNVPRAKINDTGFTLKYEQSKSSADATFFAGPYGNMVSLTAPGGTVDGPLLPEDMWNLDTKLDDGRPAFGRMLSLKPSGAQTCATSTTASSAEYSLTTTTRECTVIYLLGV